MFITPKKLLEAQNGQKILNNEGAYYLIGNTVIIKSLTNRFCTFFLSFTPEEGRGSLGKSKWSTDLRFKPIINEQ